MSAVPAMEALPPCSLMKELSSALVSVLGNGLDRDGTGETIQTQVRRSAS